MTISTINSTETFIGNGSTTAFSFTFVADQASDLEVVYTDADGNATTLNPVVYNVTLNPIPLGGLWGIGGTVTYPLSGTPIQSGTTLTVTRIVPYTQSISINNQGAFYPTAVEQGLDVLELQIQQLNTDLVYSLKAPLSDPNPPANIPSASVRALKYFAFDSAGNPIAADTPEIIIDPSMLTVTSIADLKALTPSISLVNTTVSVAGYVSAGDGGGGLFLLTNVNPGADNGGTIIWSSTAGYYYTRIFSGAIDARWFGCVGGSDCSTAMGNALAAAAGGTLAIVGDHVYNISSGPNTINSNTTIVGYGTPTINNTYDGVMWHIPNDAHDITVDGILFSGVAKQHIGTDNNSNATQLRFLNSFFTGCTLNTATSVYLTPLLLDTVTYVYVDNCVFYGNGRGPDASSDNVDLMFGYNGDVNDHIFITDSTFSSTNVVGNIFGFNVNHFNVEGCTCSGPQTFTGAGAGGYGILAYSASISETAYINIRGNKISNTGGSGIYVTGGVWVNIIDNILDQVCLTQLDVSLPAAGISLNGPSIFNIEGNIVTNSVQNGITVTSASVGTIVGNTIYKSASNQIHLRGVCSNVTVTGNTCNFGQSDDIMITQGVALTITGNTLVSGGRSVGSINAGLLNYSSIISNIINGSYKHGIVIQAGSTLTISGNNILDSSTSVTNSFDGINSAADKSLISSNTSGNTGATGARYGINSSGNYCTIASNILLGNKTNALNLSGTNLNKDNNRISTGAISGSFTLASGTATITTAEIKTGDMVLLECTAASGTQGIVRVSTITDATSFVVTSSQPTDASTYNYRIIH